MGASRLEALKKFVEADPTDTFSRYGLALEYVRAEQHEQAIQEFNRVIETDPNYIAAYDQLGKLLVNLGRKDDAREILNRGIEVAISKGQFHARDEMQKTLAIAGG